MRVCCWVAGTGGVAFYRIKQPYGWLIEQGKDVFIYDPLKHDSNRLHQEQMAADVIVYQCPWSEGMLNAAKLVKQGDAFGKKKKIVVELDDNLFDVDPWNEKYNMFGCKDYCITVDATDIVTQNRFIENTKNIDWIRTFRNKDGSLTLDMWRDGYRGFDIEANQRKRKATIELLNIADLITVTTVELGNQLRKYAPKTRMAVLPNLVDPERWLPMKKNDTDEIRIGWQGGSAHFDDLRMIIADLKSIHDKNKNVKFVFMGVQYDSLMEEFDGAIEWVPWHGDIATYPLVVRDMKLDIALAPLKDTTFNRGKSQLKWIEYSIMGVPTIASDVVYKDYISHGKTGMIARQGEWEKYIQELIDDKEKRLSIGKKAKERIKNKYSIDKSILWYEALNDIM